VTRLRPTPHSRARSSWRRRESRVESLHQSWRALRRAGRPIRLRPRLRPIPPAKTWGLRDHRGGVHSTFDFRPSPFDILYSPPPLRKKDDQTNQKTALALSKTRFPRKNKPKSNPPRDQTNPRGDRTNPSHPAREIADPGTPRNSPAVAAKHYLQATEQHFERGARAAEAVQQLAASARSSSHDSRRVWDKSLKCRASRDNPATHPSFVLPPLRDRRRGFARDCGMKNTCPRENDTTARGDPERRGSVSGVFGFPPNVPSRRHPRRADLAALIAGQFNCAPDCVPRFLKKNGRPARG